MKTFRILTIIATALATLACEKNPYKDTVTDPITISSPEPTTPITKVALSETQQGYVKAGNAMAFRLLKQMYNGKDLVCSPLSLQYALAMTANGASGETLQEIINFLGYGDDGIEALNEYSKILLEQLPAVDMEVKLKVTDALLVNDRFPLLPAFKNTVEQSYYAAVDNMPFTDPAQVAARVNEWASRSTDGFIEKVLDTDDISDEAVAFLMNALYFKAKWAGSEYDPMFIEDGTRTEAFVLANDAKTKVKMMNTCGCYQYAIMDGFKVLALPYAGGKYFMYILLPDKNDLPGLLTKMQTIAWSDITSRFSHDAEVYVKLPKFDIEDKYYLTETLQDMGVNRAFKQGQAKFDRMFAPKTPEYDYWIGKVIQKARISVAEWGTEAAAVTVVEMYGETAVGPGEEPKRINFYCDHPFVFLIGESTSGTILFEGAFTGLP